MKSLAVPVLCRDNVMQARNRGARRAGARPCVQSAFPHVQPCPQCPRSLRSKFGGNEKLRSRNFGEFRNSRFSGIRDSADSEISCRSHALPRQRHAGKEAGREARVCLEHVSAWPTMPALPHDRSGASLGNSKISDFEMFVVRFGPHLPYLALSYAQSLPFGGTFRFLQNLPENIDF